MPEENIQDFLTTYLNHANHPSLSIEQLTLEFNLFTAYINLSKLIIPTLFDSVGFSDNYSYYAKAISFGELPRRSIYVPPRGKSVIC